MINTYTANIFLRNLPNWVRLFIQIVLINICNLIFSILGVWDIINANKVYYNSMDYCSLYSYILITISYCLFKLYNQWNQVVKVSFEVDLLYVEVVYNHWLIFEKYEKIPFEALLMKKNLTKLDIINTTTNLKFVLIVNKNGWDENDLNNIYTECNIYLKKGNC